MKKIALLLLFPILVRSQTAPAGALPIKAVVTMEYWAVYWGANNVLYGYANGSLLPVALPLPGGQTVVAIAGGFNRMVAVSNTGQVYLGGYYNVTPTVWTLIPTDTLGNTINDATAVWAFQDTYILRRANGSLWLGGIDNAAIFTTSTNYMRPLRLTSAASGLSFTQASASSYGILAVASDSTVYQWLRSTGASPKHITLPGGTGKALAVANGNGNPFSYASFALVQQTPGSPYGHPVVWGNNWGLWGSATAQSFTTPIDLFGQWGLKVNLAEIDVGTQTIQVIDSAGNRYASGFNPQGEIGNGQEQVNRYTYPGFPGGGWDYQPGEAPTLFSQIASGIKWKHAYTNRCYGFYWYGSDAQGNLYSWGRGKSLVLGNGVWTGFNWNAQAPNLCDITTPTLITPLTTPVVIYNPTLPTRGAGPDQTITATWVNLSATGSANLSVTGHPLWLVNSTKSADTLCCSYTNFHWVEESGVIPVTILRPDSASTWVGPMLIGAYRFRVTTTDNRGGLDTASVQITLNPAMCPLQRTAVSMVLTIYGYPISVPLSSAIIKYSDGTTQKN
jgi:hypothetical protein